ncbi:lysine exporter protein (LysE/YggA) [Fibrella aestuarina BUZ 2]|uniref:Lysine exporter protein (LysE/YggA) n=1 Tax=Fibrella aestuarina BUZ 2 TaxID=1166018 RepID=I0K8L4_9BACT|nr:LysE family transporter [Fibrella aestuarina]CCH00467.1 lysine exporter protein (LysE/YggA) [Fibrella aestuarina BUZ 2]
MILPVLLGFLTGVALCLTFGTVFFALIQNSVDNGYKAGLTITAGVVLGDLIYVTFALLGTSMIPHSEELEPVLAFIGVVFLIVLGLFNIIKGTPRIAYPKTKLGNYAYYFTTGFLLNALNPINFVSWVTIAAYLRHSLRYTANQQVVFMAFALVGVAVAEASLAIFAHKLKRLFTPKVALAFNRVTGVVFIVVALRLAWVKLLS